MRLLRMTRVPFVSGNEATPVSKARPSTPRTKTCPRGPGPGAPIWRLRRYGEVSLGEGGVEVVDGLVDFLRVLESDGDGVDTGVLEGELHGSGAIGVAVGELTAADEFHADDAHALAVHLFDVLDNFTDVVGIVVVVPGGAVHARASVVHADHGDLEPLVAGHLTEGGQAVHRGAAGADGLLVLLGEDAVLPALGCGGPVIGVLPMEEHDVEVVGLSSAQHVVEALCGIDAFVGGDLGT